MIRIILNGKKANDEEIREAVMTLRREGVVVEVSGNGDNEMATVDFSRAGTKRLVVRYAPLRRLD